MPNACSLGGIDERALRVAHNRRRRRDQQRSFDSIERAGERLGLLHIPLHDFDIGKITDGSRLGGVAHQRPNLDALTGEFPHRRLTVVSRCARNQDHGCSFVEEFLTPTRPIHVALWKGALGDGGTFWLRRSTLFGSNRRLSARRRSNASTPNVARTRSTGSSAFI